MTVTQTGRSPRMPGATGTASAMTGKGGLHAGRVNAASIVYATAAAYTILFDFLPEQIRLGIAGAVGLFLFVSALLPENPGPHSRVTLSNLGIFLLVLASCITYVFEANATEQAASYFTGMIRLLTAISAVAFFSRARFFISSRLLIIIFASIALSAILSLALFGTFMLAGTPRPYPFTGSDGVHSSAYAVTASFIGIVILKRLNRIGWKTALVLGIPLFALIAAYQVRTTWVLTILFLGTASVLEARQRINRDTQGAIIAFAMTLLMLAILMLLIFPMPGIDLVAFSSGRTAVYVERFDIISQRTAFDLVFGTGPGSDRFFSSTWWWDKKDSHNDFLHFIIETGFLGFTGLMIVLASVLWRANSAQIPILVSLIGSSMVSNGLLERPLLAVLFAGLLAIAARPGEHVS